MVIRSVVLWSDLTKTHWNSGPGAGVTHLSEPYARETLCGISKVNKPTLWDSEGDGCQACADEWLGRIVRYAVEKTNRFVDGD